MFTAAPPAAAAAMPAQQQQQQQPVTSAPPTAAPVSTPSNASNNSSSSSNTWIFHAKLRLAVDQGVVSEALAAEIKLRFAAPFDITGAASQPQAGSNTSTATTTAAAAGGAVPWLSLATQQSRASETRQKDLDARHVVVAMELLNLLLMCDSGYYNSESNTTTTTTTTAGEEEGGVRGLHAAVAAIARSASSNIVQYLRKELTSSSLGAESLTTLVQRHAVPLVAERSHGLQLLADRHAAMDGLGAAQQEQESRMWHLHGMGHNPIVLSAQCLYLLTRHFQLQASSVKEMLELAQLLLLQLPYESGPVHTIAAATAASQLSGSRGKTLRAALCQAPGTAATCALLWLVVFATVNTVAVWKKLRGANGELAHNVLLHSDVAALLAEATRSIRQKVDAMEEQQQQHSHYHYASGRPSAGAADPCSFLSSHAAQTRLLSTPGTRAAYNKSSDAEIDHGTHVGRASGALLQQQQQQAGGQAVARRPWLDALAGFVSVLTLAEACLLRAKGDERGYDRALEAFIGDRGHGGAGGGATPLSPASPWRGKVAERMVQLAPITEALRIPAEYVYIAPYEILSYVFDSLVPVLRRLAELELASYRRYIDQMQLSEPMMAGSAADDAVAASTAGWRPSSGGCLLPVRDGLDATLERRAARVASVTEEPFTTYMAPILAALATCLGELPSEVLNPDLDSDCAATFFIFRNCARHLVHVFAVQQRDGAGSSQWQDFTLKTVTQFLNVLTMIGRHAQYLPRLIAMLSGTQAACPELQWGSLMAQAIECAGLNTTTTTRADGGSSAARNESGRAGTAAGERGGGAVGANGAALGPPRHRQFTAAYSRRRRQDYLTSCFLLLRQLVTSRALRGIVNDYLGLDAALAFLAAPRQSQGTLGSTLSLLAALIASAEDAARVWDYLAVHKLLLPSSTAAGRSSLASAAAAAASGNERSAGSEETTTSLSLIGHARYEGTQGRYQITIGLLHLLMALCRYDVAHATADTLAGYTALVDFVAQEVMRGVARRLFIEERERWTVLALAAAALRQALLVRFVAEPQASLVAGANNVGVVTGAIPLTVVMATNKAPNDILGELLQCIYRASIAPYDLGSLERAALRQCLRLLNVALHVLSAQQLELFAFEARTVQSESLPYHLLLLCGMGHDEALLASCLELLLLLPAATVTQAARQLHATPQRLAGITGRLAALLQPGSLPAPVIRAPPELAFLDEQVEDNACCEANGDDAQAEGSTTGSNSDASTCSAAAVSHKALLLDLLIQHAAMAAPSLTLLLCGFYDAAMTHTTSNTSSGSSVYDGHGAQEGGQDGTAVGMQGTMGNALFASVLDGAVSGALEQRAPALAVKYVKLLYLLRANARYGTSLIRPSMERGSQHLFFQLQHFCPQPQQCRLSPLLLCRYAYILRLLALETLHTARGSAEQLSLRHGGVPRVSVEVLLSLLLPSSSATGNGGARLAQCAQDDGGRTERPMSLLSRGAAADLAQWLTQVLAHMPVFPSYQLPPVAASATHASTGNNSGGSSACYTVLAADGVVQLDLVAIFEALQRAQAQRQLPPLSFDELRERLQPFVLANDCLMHYAGVTSFVEAWCQLVEVACSVVRHLPQARLRTLVQNVLAGVELTRGMTAAAQERVVRRLFSALSTLLAHLLRRVQEEIAEDDEENGNGNEEVAAAHRDIRGASSGNNTATAVALPHRRRRPREEDDDVSGQATSSAAMHGGTRGWRRLVGNQCLLRPLLTAVVQWGAVLPAARVDLYNSLLCWTMIPGVELEDIVLYRTQEALLRLLAQDIAGACHDGDNDKAAAALRWAATTLLVRLLTRSSTLCDAFCHLGTDTASPLAVQCGLALLRTTGQAMNAYFATALQGTADAGVVLGSIQNCFDCLCAMALRHGGRTALSGPLLAACLGLDVWTHGTQVMLGSNSSNVRGAMTGTTLSSSQLVWCGFLRGVLRWLNVVLMCSTENRHASIVCDDAAASPLLAQLRDFVAARRQLLETALHMPLLLVSAAPAVVLDHTTLSLCAEFMRLLRGLASASGALAMACRTLVHEMALPELLRSLCALPMPDTGALTVNAAQRLAPRWPLIGSSNLPSNSASMLSMVVLAAAVRDTAHLLLRAECAGGRYDTSEPTSPALGVPMQDGTSGGGPLMRHNAAHVECTVHATEALASRMQDVRRAYTAQPTAELVLSYESYLLALQALVCLMHSLVLPASHTESHGEGGVSMQIAGQRGKAVSYLRCLPLAAMHAALQHVQQMVSEDGDAGGMLPCPTIATAAGNAAPSSCNNATAGRAYLTPSTEETVVAAMRAAQREAKTSTAGRRRMEDAAGMMPHQTSSGSGANNGLREGSLPATPLIHPADGTRLMGTKTAPPQSSTSATPRGSVSEARRMPTETSATALPSPQQQQQQYSGEQSQSPVQAADPDTTLGDLLASTTGGAAAAADVTQRTARNSTLRGQSVKESIETCGVALRPDAAESHARMPHLVRQVRIAVANALCATQSAMSKVNE